MSATYFPVMPFFSASKIEDGVTASGAGKQAVGLAEGLIFDCQEGLLTIRDNTHTSVSQTVNLNIRYRKQIKID
jgi:hypothetical protein